MAQQLPTVWKASVQQGNIPGTMKISLLVEGDWEHIAKGEASAREVMRVVQAAMVAVTDLLAPEHDLNQDLIEQDGD